MPDLRSLLPVSATIALAFACATLAKPVDTPAAETPDTTGAVENIDAPAADAPYLRAVEDDGRTVRLEITSRRFEPRDGQGPSVTLVGVAHIGDGKFYGQLQALLDSFDVVLFESVTPAGTGGAGGETADERIDSTREAIRFVGAMVEIHREQKGTFPATMDEVAAFSASLDSRMPELVRRAGVDAWSRDLVYTRHADADGYDIVSLGAGGEAGGTGEAADLRLSEIEPLDPATLQGDEAIQADLARALGLEFQLEVIDYARPNWRCSDMSVDQVSRSLERHGGSFGPLESALGGSSLPAKLAKLMLWLIRTADAMTDGTVSAMFKVVLIEVLSDPAVMEASFDQLGKGFREVIVDERNQVVVDDLRGVIENEPEVESVGIFYGAAHMGDMAARMDDQLGYEPSSEEWFTAIEVDLARAQIPPRQLAQIRRMIKSSLRSSIRRSKKKSKD